MNKFLRLGFISYNGKIEVNNSLLTAVLYDKPEIERGILSEVERWRRLADGLGRLFASFSGE